MKRLQIFAGWTLVAILVAAVLWGLPGCVSLEAPKTFNEKLAYAYASVAASRNTAASLLERKRLSKDEAAKIQALADQARGALDLARGTAVAGDVKTAQGQLDLALKVLLAIEARLKEAQ